MTKPYEYQGLVDDAGLEKALTDYDDSLAKVAKTNDYNDLDNKPLVFDEGSSGTMYLSAFDFLGPSKMGSNEHLFQLRRPSTASGPISSGFEFTGPVNGWSDIFDFFNEVASRYGLTDNYLDDERFNGAWYGDRAYDEYTMATPYNADTYGVGIVQMRVETYWKQMDLTTGNPIDSSQEIQKETLGYIAEACIDGGKRSIPLGQSFLEFKFPNNTGFDFHGIEIHYNDSQGGIYQGQPYDTYTYENPGGSTASFPIVLVGVDVDLVMNVTDNRIPTILPSYFPVQDVEYKLWNQLDHPDYDNAILQVHSDITANTVSIANLAASVDSDIEGLDERVTDLEQRPGLPDDFPFVKTNHRPVLISCTNFGTFFITQGEDLIDTSISETHIQETMFSTIYKSDNLMTTSDVHIQLLAPFDKKAEGDLALGFSNELNYILYVQTRQGCHLYEELPVTKDSVGILNDINNFFARYDISPQDRYADFIDATVVIVPSNPVDTRAFNGLKLALIERDVSNPRDRKVRLFFVATEDSSSGSPYSEGNELVITIQPDEPQITVEETDHTDPSLCGLELTTLTVTMGHRNTGNAWTLKPDAIIV